MRVCLCFLGCDTEKEIWRDKNEWNDFVCETNDELTKISHTPEKTLVDEAKGEMEKGGGKRQVPCRAVPCHTMPCRGILSRIKHSKLSVKTFYLSKTNIYIQNALTENKFFSLVWFGLVIVVQTDTHRASVLTIFYYDQLVVVELTG